jgi:ABC-type sugar transport system ATPase subunit
MLLQLEGIEKSFPGARVLRGVSFDLEAGQVHALVGANGAGKSTLIKILAGAYVGDAGVIRIDGQPARIRTPADAIARGVGVIYQEFNLVPELSVAENILLGAEPVRRLLGVPLLARRELFEAAERHLLALGFPLRPAQPVKSLTTGEKQLVEIAKALHRQARILVLDEPTAALTRGETERLFAIIRGLRERGLGLIYISHHLEEVFEISDRITVLRDGACVATWPRGEVTEADLVRAMVGRDVAAEPRPEARPGPSVLQAEGLCGVGFQDVTLQLQGGQITALTGAAGAGQTDLCWALAGASAWTRGTLRVDGRPVRWRSVPEAIAGGVLLAPGDRKAYGIVAGLDVRANLTFADLQPYTRFGVLNRGAQTRAARELITRYGVRCTGPEQEIASLSGGNQQKVVVGRVAERKARVYLFDEPTRGVDVGAREDIYALIRQLAAGGAAVLVSTPDLQEALRLGDRIGVFRAGRLVLEAAAAETGEAAVMAAILGGEQPREEAA